MRSVRMSALAVTAVALGLSGSAALAQTPASAGKVGFIDMQRVVVRSAAGVAVREQLERERALMQREMDGKRQELEKLRDELEKKGALMSADARREKQDVYDRKRRDFTRLADDFQKELEKKERGLLQKVLLELSGVVERVGRERGYALIVEKAGASVLYSAAEADLTDDIIRAYDQQAGTKGKK